jgi:ABC-type nitrate/sulfonate/bicarbonate transport system substrate-binding protein
MRRLLTTSLLVSLLAGSAAFATIGGAASATTLTKVKFVYDFPGPDMELIPVLAAAQQGYFAKAGLSVSVLFPPNTSTTSQMLTTGSADVGFLTTSDMAVAVQAKAPLVSIANYSMTNNWGLFAKPGSTLTLKTLKGKKIFSWGDTWTNAMIPFVLKKAGLTQKDITIITASNDTPLLLAGKIDFTTSTSNYAIPGIVGATGKQPVGIVGTAAGVPNIPIWVYAVTKSYAAKHPSTAKAFLSAVLQGTKWAIANPTSAAKMFDKAYPKSGYSDAYNLLGWQKTIPLLTNAQGKFFVQNDAQWTTLDQGLKATKQIASIPAASTYYTNSFLPKQ